MTAWLIAAVTATQPPMYPDRAAPGWVIRARKSDADGRERTACLNLRICECRCGAPGWRTIRLGVGDPM